MTRRKIVPIARKKLWHKVWGDASYLSRTLTLALLVGAFGTAFGFIGGWFQGCQEDFEDNKVNARQDTLIKANIDTGQSLTKFRLRQKRKNEQYDSLFEQLGMERKN